LVSQSLPRLGCLWGTFSPSRCQIRSTRLSLMSSPPGAAVRRSCDSHCGRIAEQARYIGGETLLVLTTARDLALCRAMLPERRAGATLGDMQLRSDLLNAGTATRGA
jgi:hypothetical protein